MSLEYKISFTQEASESFSLEDLRKLNHFWRFDEDSNSYFLGQIEGTDWPEVMIWGKGGNIGVALNATGIAWTEFKELISALKHRYPGLTITDWDSDEDLEEDFFS